MSISNSDALPQIKWPSCGRNSRFLILNIPLLTKSTVDKCLSFIGTTCCYVSKDRVRRFIHIQDMQRKPKSTDPIQLEHFLSEDVELDSTDVDDRKIDYCRYQTSPEDSCRLLECPARK